jgi:hypothetical protein
VVTLVAAPMPVLGSHLPDWLNALGFHADLRATFYAGIPFVIIAGLVARRIHEPDAREAGELLRNLPAHLARRKPLVEAAE